MTVNMIEVLDIFAGAGGFSCGFKLAGYNIIGGIEIDKWAGETFSFNHSNANVLITDIQDLSDTEIKRAFPNKPKVIIGGPPCQGFSICNKNSGDPTNPRNSLFKEFIRVGDLLKPDVLIMENVPNLLKAMTESNESIINIIVNELKSLGYNVYTDVLEAIDFGIPQIRKRLFIISSKIPLENPFPKPTHALLNGNYNLKNFDSTLKPCPVLWDAISDLPEINSREGAEKLQYPKEPQNEYQAFLREDSNYVWNHIAMKHTKRMIERFKSMSWGESVSDVPNHLRPFKRGSNGTISDKVYDQNNRRMHPYKQCHTIPASFYANFVHPFNNRNFTAREGARIQSFPDWYIFKGKPTVVSHKLLTREERLDEKYLCQYNQIGNAVPPLLAKAIAENLKNQLYGGK